MMPLHSGWFLAGIAYTFKGQTAMREIEMGVVFGDARGLARLVVRF
jgi:hypothetical protein